LLQQAVELKQHGPQFGGTIVPAGKQHRPPWQTWLPLQHVPPQLVWPDGQTHVVPEHTPPVGQVAQVPPQRVVPVGHAHTHVV
jgi:hypothetical protein